jgi:RimJ/RimL family protein N-acetyltransferase
VRDYGLRVLGRRRLVSLIYPENLASIRVAEKNGMAYERDAEFFQQRLLLYSLSAREDSVGGGSETG